MDEWIKGRLLTVLNSEKGKAIFIPSLLLEILLVQMLGLKIEDNHLPDRTKRKNPKLGSSKFNDHKLSCTRYWKLHHAFQVEMERSLHGVRGKTAWKISSLVPLYQHTAIQNYSRSPFWASASCCITGYHPQMKAAGLALSKTTKRYRSCPCYMK